MRESPPSSESALAAVVRYPEPQILRVAESIPLDGDVLVTSDLIHEESRALTCMEQLGDPSRQGVMIAILEPEPEPEGVGYLKGREGREEGS